MISGAPMTKVPADFFGMHINKVAVSQPIGFQTPWCDVNQTWHRIWDNYTTWKLINTADGVFGWSRLDNVVDIAGTQHGKKLVMGIGCAPDWATGASTGGSQYSPYVPTDASWTAWVTALATRYKGRIQAYELWNEPSDGLFWNGTIAQLVHLCALAYPIIKAIDPDAIVLSPCYPSILSVPQFALAIRAGMADYCDWVSFHAYSGANPPEYLAYVTENYQGVLRVAGVTKPLIDTEGGWLTYVNQAGATVTGNTASDVMTDQQGAAYYSRRGIIMASTGVRVSFVYTVDGQADGVYLMKPTMVDYATRSVKQRAAYAQAYVAGLLAAGFISKPLFNGTYYSAPGVTATGQRFAALWCRDWKTATIPAAVSGAVVVRDCLGATVPVVADTINLSMEPTFLFF